MAHSHRARFPALCQAACVGLLNRERLALVEIVARHLVRHQKAVKKNAKSPDYSGLNHMVSSSLDTVGGVPPGEFSRWHADLQKSEAFTLKQQRLCAEEVVKLAKAPTDPQLTAKGG